MKHVSNSSVMNPHMKQEQDRDIFSNVIRYKWCAEVIIVKVHVKGFIPKCKVLIWREKCVMFFAQKKIQRITLVQMSV